MPSITRHTKLALICALLLPCSLIAEDAETDTGALGYCNAVILGGVEGVTEYLPVSSTGHLILTENVLGLNDRTSAKTPQPQQGAPENKQDKSDRASAVDAYCIVIQTGAIAAVVILYWKDLWLIILGLVGRSRTGFKLGLALLLAFLPAAVLGLLFNHIIESYLFGPVPVAIALAAGAPFMLGVEYWRKRRMAAPGAVALPEKEMQDITPAQALFIGLMQSVAMWPGTSRSMMTITGGYMIGLTPAKSARFSFLLGLITLTAATAFTLLKHGHEMAAQLSPGPVIAGFVVATITAALSVRWLVGYLSSKGLALFAYYRLAVALIIVMLLCL
jgi:undecaprenyl-diphosphatase